MFDLKLNDVGQGLSFREKESVCEQSFTERLREDVSFWHVCTPGNNQSIILQDLEITVFAMNAVWMSVCETPTVHIYTFEWMSNHFHALVSGTKEQAIELADRIKLKLKRYSAKSKRALDLSGFVCEEPIPVGNLETFRNTVAYINRNNFVADANHNPFSYPYGANAYFFNLLSKRFLTGRYGDLTVARKRKMVHSHHIGYPPDAVLMDGYVSPVSYCDIAFAERMFRDSRQYFTMVSRSLESSKEIAKALGDNVYYTDDELFAVVSKICKDEYADARPSLINPKQKIALAKRLHNEYNAGNGQIQRMLKLERSLVDELFPMSAKSRTKSFGK